MRDKGKRFGLRRKIEEQDSDMYGHFTNREKQGIPRSSSMISMLNRKPLAEIVFDSSARPIQRYTPK